MAQDAGNREGLFGEAAGPAGTSQSQSGRCHKLFTTASDTKDSNKVLKTTYFVERRHLAVEDVWTWGLAM